MSETHQKTYFHKHHVNIPWVGCEKLVSIVGLPGWRWGFTLIAALVACLTCIIYLLSLSTFSGVIIGIVVAALFVTAALIGFVIGICCFCCRRYVCLNLYVNANYEPISHLYNLK